MNSSQKIFRWCFNLFIFLMCFQLGMLLFLKGLVYEAGESLKEHQVKVGFQCGDFNNDESYWSLQEDKQEPVYCKGEKCPESLWQNPDSLKEGPLHVVSVLKPEPSRKVNGKWVWGQYVDVHIEPSEKPMTLALVSQSMMQWNLKVPKNTKIKKIIVVSPEIVWVNGLSKDVPMSYFPKKTICAYPHAWEELSNPQNEYRRLHRALKEYSGLDITSFQGRSVGREFKVPYSILKPLARREPSSQKQNSLSLGVQWERKDQRLSARSFQFLKDSKVQKVEVPFGTTAGHYDKESDKIYLLNKFQFGTWDWQKKKFAPVLIPLDTPNMRWPTAMTFNEAQGKIYIYNDAKGGQLYSYDVRKKQWQLVSQKIGYSLVAMSYNSVDQRIYGAKLNGSKLVEVIKLGEKGQVEDKIMLSKPLDFSKSLWRMQMVSGPKELWLKLVHPAHPGGDVYPLSQIKISM